MKRLMFSILAILLLTAGAAVAQNTNTTAPGPTQQLEPSETNNNLPNPGNPQTVTGNNEMVENESLGTTGTTGTTTGTNLQQTGTETEEAEGMDVDVDAGENAAGAVDVDVTRDADRDTDATGVNELGLDNDRNQDRNQRDQDTYGTTGTTGTTYDQTGTLPDTAGELPLLLLAGLLALASAFSLRVARRSA